MANESRLQDALKDLNIDSCDFELRAKQLNELLVGYSLFWGTNDDGDAFIEWYNDRHHSITLTYFRCDSLTQYNKLKK